MVIFQMTGGDVVILIGGDSRPDVFHCELRNDGVRALHDVWCVHAVVGEDSHFENDVVRRFFLAAVHARVLMEIFLEVFLGHLYRIDPCLQQTIHTCIQSNLCGEQMLLSGCPSES